MTDPSTLPGEPAAIARRFLAAILDALAMSAISAFLYYVPLRFGALALPLLGALVAILVWDVVPCAFFRGTPAMRALGLEMIGVDGRRVDFGEVLSREMLGRGLIGFAYFSTAIVGIVGYLSGSIAFFQPRGMGLILFFISGTLILLSFCGQAIILSRKDRRGLPDLMAKTIIIRRGSAKAQDLELDEEEKKALKKAAARRVRNVAIFDAITISFALLLPYLLSRPSTAAADFQARVKRASVEQQFNTNPSNPSAAADLVYLLQAAGERERANEIEAKHKAALQDRASTRETALKDAIAKDPKAWDNVASLIELYEQTEQLKPATDTYRKFIAADPTADNRAAFGAWLYEHAQYEAAIIELKRAIEEGVPTAEAHAYLGWAYKQVNKDEESKAELQKAREIDPDLEDVEQMQGEDGETPPGEE